MVRNLFEINIKLRTLKLSDYDSIVSLQQKCFPGMKPWSKEQFENMLNIFKDGQICIKYNDKIIASSSSILLNFDEYSDEHSWAEITGGGFLSTHNEKGDTLYGIEIMVDPKYQGMKISRRLYHARKVLARKLNAKRIVIGGRITGYYKHRKKLTAREYVEKVINKELIDPVLTPQLANGFALIKLIPDYLPSDKESCGYATFLEWTNIDYEPEKSSTLEGSTNYIRVCAIQYQMRSVKNFDDFAKHCKYFIDVASDYRCDFILFPEMFTTQLLSFFKPMRPALAMRKLNDFTSQFLKLFNHMSIKYNINIIGGSHFTIEKNNLYNISYIFKRDGSIEKQYKIHITPNEKKWWGVQPGNKVNVFNTDRGKIAVLICYDIEFPELARIAASKGANIIFVPFNTDERSAYLRVKYCAQARCIENQLFAVISGCTGNLPFVENLDIHYSQSAILTPSDIPFERDGVAAECSPNIEAMIYHDLDINLIKRHKRSGNVLNWKDRRTDIYKLSYREEDIQKEI